MGREIKRVAPDFNWPLSVPWQGYLNPHWRKCPEDGKTCFNGQNAAGVLLESACRLLTLAADDARRGTTHPYFAGTPFGHASEVDWSKQPESARRALLDLWSRLAGRDAAECSFGLIGQDYQLYFRLLELAGLCDETDWPHCPVCGGEGIDPAVREAYEAWEQTNPPAGEGWQLWETVSEGSPISPVFPTAEALAAWCEAHQFDGGRTLSDGEPWNRLAGGTGRLSRGEWLTFIKKGWAPSAVADDHGFRSGVEAVAEEGQGP